ncbi:LCP family glycopolymer transferase [Pseudogracilibacillus sp. ICA-222130]|uniref:LCP family glycopolymer transferase n=1 Tax=Pseudogracilibacillus sp. ICA-222130 TaxID=3134655 RepID=UPI0030BB570E
MAENKRSRKKAKKGMTWKKWLLLIIGIFVLAVGALIAKVYIDIKRTASDIHEIIPERPKSDMRDSEIAFDNQDPFSILLLGVDAREGDSGRSDTMIVMTINPKKDSSMMVSIPRDTLTEIVGQGNEDKLNHAFAFGGVKMALDSTENLMNIPLDYAVQVNMESFKEIVDAVGGVDVNNSIAFDGFSEGNIHLNGEDALAYVRMRKQDPRGDFGRQDRQKQIVQAVMKEGASVSSIMNYKEIFDSISANVRTNLDFDDMVDIQKNYRDATKDVHQLYFERGEGQMINGVWYYIMNEEELNEVSTQLREHLELD